MVFIKQKSLNKSDIEIIYIQCNIGKYIGLLPTVLENNISIWYLPVLLLLFVVVATFEITNRVIAHSTILAKSSYIIKFISVVSSSVNLFYIGASFLTSQFANENWKKLVKNINSVEKMLSHEDFVININVNLYKGIIIAYHIILLVFYLCQNVYWVLQDQIWSSRLSFLPILTSYCQTLDVILIVTFSQLLRRRYNYLTKLINCVIKSRHIQIALRQEERKRKAVKLRNVFFIYQNLYKSVEQLNNIFGWKIYYILQTTVFVILSALNIVIHNIQDQYQVQLDNAVMFTVFFPLFCIIITVVLVLSCNAIEKSGERVITTYYSRLVDLEESSLREELYILAKCTQQLAPKMSAIGFFTLNQSTLASMFSFITTYLIVIIQFNML